MIKKIELFAVAIPMTQVVAHARASRSTAENLIAVVELDDGIVGAGESVPREYVTGETLQSAFDAIMRLDVSALGSQVLRESFLASSRILEEVRLPELLRQGGVAGLAASSALELALLDALGKRFRFPLQKLAKELGVVTEDFNAQALDQCVSTVVTLAEGELRSPKALPPFVRHVKVKVGRTLDEDLALLKEVRNRFGYEFSLSVDVNMAWRLEEALRAEKRFSPFKVDWYEEPFSKGAFDECRGFREACGASVMLDESLCSFKDGETAVKSGACDYFNIRISKCGGLIGAIRLIELANRNGIGFQLGAQVGQAGVLVAADWALIKSVRGIRTWESYYSSGYLEDALVDQDLEAGLWRIGTADSVAGAWE